MWVPGTEFHCSGRTASALNSWANLPVPHTIPWSIFLMLVSDSFRIWDLLLWSLTCVEFMREGHSFILPQADVQLTEHCLLAVFVFLMHSFGIFVKITWVYCEDSHGCSVLFCSVPSRPIPSHRLMCLFYDSVVKVRTIWKQVFFQVGFVISSIVLFHSWLCFLWVSWFVNELLGWHFFFSAGSWLEQRQVSDFSLLILYPFSWTLNICDYAIA